MYGTLVSYPNNYGPFSQDGSLSDSISVTTEEYNTEYYGSSSGSASDRSAVSSSAEKARLMKLRRRRKKYLRRRALEHAAGADSEDEDDASLHYGALKLGAKKKQWVVPSQESRQRDGVLTSIVSPANKEQTHETSVKSAGGLELGAKKNQYILPTQELRKSVVLTSAESSPAVLDTSFDSAAADILAPDLVNTTQEDSFLDTTNEGLDNAEGGNVVSFSNPLPPCRLKWQSISISVPKLLPKPCPRDNLLDKNRHFLEQIHLGQLVIRSPYTSLIVAGLQLGDVVIRLNDEDVSKLDGKDVCKKMMDMSGESVRLTFLRKNILV